MKNRESIEINEFPVTKNESSKRIVANKITFFNLGNIPVYVGLIPVMPGDSYMVNYEHPHIISRVFRIRFDTAATPISVQLREDFGLVNSPLLVIQTMTPIL